MKKEILVPALILFLGLIFIIINVIVYFSKGNTWLISKKIKVGVLILSLTTLFSCGSSSNHNNEPTCYITPSSKYIDSMKQVKQNQESLLNAEKPKQFTDSIIEEKNKNNKIIMCYSQPIGISKVDTITIDDSSINK